MKRNVISSSEDKEVKHKRKVAGDGATKSTKEDPIKKLTSTSNLLKDYVKTSSTSDVYANPKLKSTATSSKTKTVATFNPATTSKQSIKSTSSSVNVTSKKSLSSLKKENVTNKTKAKTNYIQGNKDDINKLSRTPRNVKPTINNNTTLRTSKKIPLTNVTVNSPPTERKEISSNKLPENTIETQERQRKKTRTLNENEIVVLKSENIDNNKEMQILTNKLVAKPKSFFIDLDENSSKQVEKSNQQNNHVSSEEDEYSYEDDFESYKSDFESYHSESNKSENEENYKTDESQSIEDNDIITQNVDKKSSIIQSDEERMLDSGNYELRDAQKSGNRVKPLIMDNIEEGFEDDKNKSLTDEGFLDMNSSNGNSSINTYSHNEIIERPIFIDFKISKENKRKRLFNERLQLRAKDLLPMIKLHEMSFSLFEMKPIPYDVYMATFGKSNYTQNSTQTYDDGVEEEIQTDIILNENKWTQNPIKFSKCEVYLDDEINQKTNSLEDLVSKFTFLLCMNPECEKELDYCNLEYKNNPLRIYLEQRNGVGSNKMLPLKQFEALVKETDYDVNRLSSFLKKVESRVDNVLSKNSGKNHNDYEKTSKYPFSTKYKSLILDNEILKERNVCDILFSETNNNFIITVHNKGKGIFKDKCLICVWDISSTKIEPVKILVAIENIILSKYKGGTNGIFVAALEDRSVQVWDLAEEPIWLDQSNIQKELQEIYETTNETTNKTQIELDREWNLENKDVDVDKNAKRFLSASAFTNSAFCVQNNTYMNDVVALEFSQHNQDLYFDGGRKNIGQVSMLQRKGHLIIWNLIQEKNNLITDIGKAYWSKIKLEKIHSFNLLNSMESVTPETGEDLFLNLNLAKRRISAKRKDMLLVKSLKDKINNRTNSNKTNVRPSSVASSRNTNTKTLPDENILLETWESGVICNDMKIIAINNVDNYLIAKNGGEVLHCRLTIGTIKINTLKLCGVSTYITSLKVSNLGYFLAGTDSGHIHMGSVLESRVLLSLDCSIFDDKIGGLGVASKFEGHYKFGAFEKKKILSIQWSQSNPFHIFTVTKEGLVSEWDLLQSDIKPKYSQDFGIKKLVIGDDGHLPSVALLTSEGDVQIHLLKHSKTAQEQNLLFKKYTSLL